MKSYGADALFLAPEYFSNVSAASIAIVGFALGIFVMSWNITTFILNGHLVSFLATTAQPFLKYCINNALIPIAFICCFCYKLILFSSRQELLSNWQVFILAISFISGFILSIIIAFAYFFGADKTIYFTYKNAIKSANNQYNQLTQKNINTTSKQYLNVSWFFSARLKIRSPKDTNYYDSSFIKSVLSKQHFAAVIAIFVAFVFLIVIGFWGDEKLFQLPAAASIILFFSVLIAAIGAFSIFFKKWSLTCLLLLYLVVNFLYKKELIDPRNKAYGLNYNNKDNRAKYNQESIERLANIDSVAKDKANYLQILNNWKAKQKDSLPVMYIINTSGGGLRSATFTMNILQQLDSIMQGNLMKQTLFITGASGGMLGASYFRELSLQKNINLQDKQWVENISTDLLNPIFSSFVSRDIIGPVQKFNYNNHQYTKDRGYAFEEKLNENTKGILNKQMQEYSLLERNANLPFLILNSTITRDGRKMIITSNPARFLMHSLSNTNINTTQIDGIDFTSFLKQQGADSLRLLSALRMNATFPYALPNVWLPTNPIIDVMDAGLKDNYGTEITIRFLDVFKDWLKENTKKIVILQIRDRTLNDWGKTDEDDDYISFVTKPFASMQHNWFKLQDYYQASQLSYIADNFDGKLNSICWQYTPENTKETAGLSFHLTTFEKQNIAVSVFNKENTNAFKKLQNIVLEK
ncbi:MAG: patatin-like phospholipase family protein [Bacteroidetes bacterium]|nr:patatin-like phospholipase family protein [Bacteroidota bacterium]